MRRFVLSAWFLVCVCLLAAAVTADDQKCAAGDPTCSAAPSTDTEATAETESSSGATNDEGEEEQEEGEAEGEDEEGMGDDEDMDWGSMGGALGNLMGGGGGGGGLGALAAAAGGALLGGGGGGGADMLGAMAGNFMKGGGGDLIGKAASMMTGDESAGNVVGNLVRGLDGDAISKGVGAMGDILRKSSENAGEDDVIQQGYGALGPMLTKAADAIKTAKQDLTEDEGKERLLGWVADFFDIEISEDGDVQEELLAQLLQPEQFRPALLKAYNMFITPTTAETVARDVQESSMVNIMETILPTSFVAKDARRDVMELIVERGYTGQRHQVTTKDGFQLTLFRIGVAKDTTQGGGEGRRHV